MAYLSINGFDKIFYIPIQSFSKVGVTELSQERWDNEDQGTVTELSQERWDNGDQGRDEERDVDNIRQALILVLVLFTFILLKVNTGIYTRMPELAWS
jgi:hypothetical protein